MFCTAASWRGSCLRSAPPAAPGEAPRGLESTGNPVFCTIWTYLGTPAITLLSSSSVRDRSLIIMMTLSKAGPLL